MTGPEARAEAQKHLATAERMVRSGELERASISAQIGTGYALLAHEAASMDDDNTSGDEHRNA